jgi:hypothetical protein
MPTNAPPAAPTALGGLASTDTKSSPIFSDADYSPVLSNWYTARPYGFKFTPRSGSAVVMFLPISPSNLTVSTQFATNVVPTLYGTVEEHSPVRYYDISIEGTTGMGPKYVHPVDARARPEVQPGRSRFTVQQTIPSSVQGFFSKTLTRAQSIYSETRSTLSPPVVSTGLQLDQTGYLAFHNLYRFLLKYKKDASGTDSNGGMSRPDGSHPLIFFNYKDNNQYKVAVKSMVMRRDKEDPMMYHYSITMRGYDLENAGTDIRPESETQRLLTDLGLDGVQGSLFLGRAKEMAARGRGVLGSLASGINQLGR